MASPPFSTVGGYPGQATNVTTPSGNVGAFTDTWDGVPSLAPGLSNQAGLTPIQIDPSLAPPGSGMPIMNAVLIELRVLNALLALQIGAAVPDLQQMRADEAWNINPQTGLL
jgi:hypothetical protein